MKSYEYKYLSEYSVYTRTLRHINVCILYLLLIKNLFIL